MNPFIQGPEFIAKIAKNVSFMHNGIIKQVEKLPTVNSYKCITSNVVVDGPVTATILSGRYAGTTLTGTWEHFTNNIVLPYGHDEKYTLHITDNGSIDNNIYEVTFDIGSSWGTDNTCEGNKTRVEEISNNTYIRSIYMPRLTFYVKNGKKTFFGFTPKSESKCEILDEFMVLLQGGTPTLTHGNNTPIVDATLIPTDNKQQTIAVATPVN